MQTYDRRAFLGRAGLTGAAAVAVAAGARRPAAAQDTELAPFLHGVASGDPLRDRVVLWTRVTPPEDHDGASIPVTWRVATDLGLADVVAEGTFEATADRDWTVRVDPTGLAPRTFHYYVFEALGRSSIVGRTLTAPAPGQEVERLRFGLVSCSSYQHGWFNAYAALAERDDVDVIIHLGDYLYEHQPVAGGGYGAEELSGVRDHEPPVEMVALDEYRSRHAQYKLDPDLRRVHQLFPFVTTWDDHESTDNSWRDGANNHDPDDPTTPNEAGVDWATRKADCQRAYDEWMPIRSTGDPSIIYRHIPMGDLVDLLVLDTRLEGRDEQVKVPGTEQEVLGITLPFAEMSDPERRIISPTQMSWLQERLSNAEGRWKVVAQQVCVGQWNVGGLPRLGDSLGVDVPVVVREGGNALNPDGWDGYTADRDRFLDHVRDAGIDNLVVLTGDVHSSWAMDLSRDPNNPLEYSPVDGSGSVGVEVVVPSVTSASLGEIAGPLADGEAAAVATLMLANPHMRYVDLVDHGFVVLDVTAERTTADWFTTPDVLVASTEAVHRSSWKADDGANHLTPASEVVVAGNPATAPGAAPPVPDTAAPAPPVPGTRGAPEPAGPALPATGGGLATVGLTAIAAAGALRWRHRGETST